MTGLQTANVVGTLATTQPLHRRTADRVETILVGLDGSTCSEMATDLAIRWAEATGARLVGLAVVDQPTICRPEPVSIGGSFWKQKRDATLLADARHKVQCYLRRFGDRCTEAGAPYRLLESAGWPAQELLRAAEACDLIVLGRQTYFHFETQDTPDETLRQVLRESRRPVLVVPEAAGEGQEVVVAFNGSSQALHALEAYLRFAGACLPAVHIVSIDPDPRRASSRAESAVTLLGRHHLRAQGHPITADGDPTRLILGQAAEFKAGLVVMGTSHRSWLSEFFCGSVTRTMLAESRAALLLCN